MARDDDTPTLSTDPDDVLIDLAQKARPDTPNVEKLAPTVEKLAGWLPSAPRSVYVAYMFPHRSPLPRIVSFNPNDKVTIASALTPLPEGRDLTSTAVRNLILEEHTRWTAWRTIYDSNVQRNRDKKPDDWTHHPILPIVTGWLERAVEIQPQRGAGLPRFQRMSTVEALALPGFDAPMPAPVRSQQVLPGFDITPVGGCPSWLLSLYDQAGGETERPGRGAPLDLRVFVGALLSVPETARDGRDVRIPITVGELADWLYPNGWDRSNRRRGWESFRQSLKNLDRLRVPIEVDGHMVGVQVVNAFVIPRSWDGGKASVVLRVAIPASAARGARVNWDRLRVYGAESAPLYRAYLSACAVLDYSARNGHGITQQIGAPELDQRGKPLRRKDGRRRIIRSTRETIPNPAAKFVGKLTDDDVRRLVGLHAQHHENRKRARSALERLNSDGVIDLRTFRDGCVQIFAPGQEH